MKKTMFYHLLLMMIAWSCISHASQAGSLSKVDQELCQKLANLKIATKHKVDVSPVVPKGNIKLALDDAIRQLAEGNRSDVVHVAKQVAAVMPKRPTEGVALDPVVEQLQASVDVVAPNVVAVSQEDSDQDDEDENSDECLDESEIEDAPVVQTRKVNLGGRCNAFYLENEDEPKRFAIIGSVYNTFCLD
ncbi:MAG: hypothetical protein P4M14_10285, partial [Gammaproteobacteria bacterium]|nr:hypothetical protein [Gammaproteobacteria bacterium]